MLRAAMGGGLEREFKLAWADGAALERLRSALGPVPARTVRQENHFFDTPARALRAARIALRLRDEDGGWFLTLKGPRLAQAGALSARPEEEQALEPARARALLAGTADVLAELEHGAHGRTELVRTARAVVGEAALRHLGAFTNERTRLGPLRLEGVSTPLVLELDRTLFPGDVRAFELEVELPAGADPDAVERALRALLARLELPWNAGENKAARFFRLLDARAGS